jgi:AraC-like DNA-binding protein
LVLPSAGSVLGLQFGGRVRFGEQSLSRAGVTGILSSARRYTYVGPTGSVLVRFTPQGAACLGVPLSELSGQSVALTELLEPARVTELSERLHAAAEDSTRVALVEELLLELPFARDPLVSRALSRLTSPDDPAAVARVARELGLSERQLERRFVAKIGIAPKRYARLWRFQRAVGMAGSASSLGALAQAAGYYDQAHFIRDFRGFVGVSPREYLRLG